MKNKKRKHFKASDYFANNYQKKKFEEYWAKMRKDYYATTTGSYIIENVGKNRLKSAIASDIAGRMKKEHIGFNKSIQKEHHSTIFKTKLEIGVENYWTALKQDSKVMQKIKETIELVDKRRSISILDFKSISYIPGVGAGCYQFTYEIEPNYTVTFNVVLDNSHPRTFAVRDVLYNGQRATKTQEEFIKKATSHYSDNNKEWAL